MNRKLRFLLCLGVVAVLNGCAMCDNGWDDAYNGYGGAVERQDRFHGRVGSILSDPTLQMSEPAPMSDAAAEADLYPEGLLEGPANDG